jgi:hypothetical protein
VSAPRAPRAARALLALACCATTVACTGTVGTPTAAAPVPSAPAASPGTAAPSATPSPTPSAPVGFQVAELSPGEAETYLGLLVQPLVGRVLSAAEREQVVARGGAAIATIVTAWATEPGFAEAARRLVQHKLSVSGTKDGIDFELPGHLAAYVVRHDLPWSTLITADHCVSAAGERIACDTGAPYTAGVLTTRAFLTSRASRFNLTRSSALMRAFACRKYPLEDTLQPRLERLSLIPMFQAQTAEEQTDPRAQSGFGNGFGCYTCHGQFSAHAQLFVKFDERGQWHADADGQQDPAGELGRSRDGLMTSHLVDPAAAREERSQMFGRPVANLAEAARALVTSPVFAECAARNLLELALGLDPASDIDARLLTDIALGARRATAEPTLGRLMIQTFTHPRVVEATLKSLGGPL